MSTTTTNQALITKIQHLLRMADPTSGASQNEMEIALRKAKELMVKHGIEQMEIGASSEAAGPGIEKESLNTGRKKRDEDRWIPVAIQKVFDVKIIFSQEFDRSVGKFGGYRHVYIFIGEPTDVAMARLVLPMIYDAMRLGLNNHLKINGIKWNTHTANSFFRGVANGFIQASTHGNQAAMKQFNKDQQDRFALVIVDKEKAITKFIDDEFKNLKKASSRSRSRHDDAASKAGFQVGSRVDATTKLK